MNVDAQAREILFRKDRICQLEMQVSILQKHVNKRGENPRYSVRDKLMILLQMEALPIRRRKASGCFGIARSTVYSWRYHIEDQKPSDAPANRTATESASLVWEITKANLSWGLWPIQVLRAIGHFSRKVTCAAPVERPQAGWIMNAPERAI
jgi:hypothetical protein